MRTFFRLLGKDLRVLSHAVGKASNQCQVSGRNLCGYFQGRTLIAVPDTRYNIYPSERRYTHQFGHSQFSKGLGDILVCQIIFDKLMRQIYHRTNSIDFMMCSFKGRVLRDIKSTFSVWLQYGWFQYGFSMVQ